MSRNNKSYSPEHTRIGAGDDLEKIQGSMPSAVNTPPPPKPNN